MKTSFNLSAALLLMMCHVKPASLFEVSQMRFYFWFDDRLHQDWVLDEFDGLTFLQCLKLCRTNAKCDGLALGPLEDMRRNHERKCFLLDGMNESVCEDNDCGRTGVQVYRKEKPIKTTEIPATTTAKQITTTEEKPTTMLASTSTTEIPTTATKTTTDGKSAEAQTTTESGTTTTEAPTTLRASTTTTSGTTTTVVKDTSTSGKYSPTAQPPTTTTEVTNKTEQTTTPEAPTTSKGTSSTTETLTKTASEPTTLVAVTATEKPTTSASTTSTQEQTTITSTASTEETTTSASSTTEDSTTLASTTTTEKLTTSASATTTEKSTTSVPTTTGRDVFKCEAEPMQVVCLQEPERRLVTGLKGGSPLFSDTRLTVKCQDMFQEDMFTDETVINRQLPFSGVLDCEKNYVMTGFEICFDGKEMQYVGSTCTRLREGFQMEYDKGQEEVDSDKTPLQVDCEQNSVLMSIRVKRKKPAGTIAYIKCASLQRKGRSI